MATVSTPISGKQIRELQSGVTQVSSTFTVPTTGAGSATADVIQMVQVPEGAKILNVTLSTTDVDTSTGHTMIVGDTDGTDDTDRYITTSTLGQTGGIVSLNNQVGHLYTFEADGTIDITVSAASTTAAAGTFRLHVLYTTED